MLGSNPIRVYGKDSDGDSESYHWGQNIVVNNANFGCGWEWRTQWTLYINLYKSPQVPNLSIVATMLLELCTPLVVQRCIWGIYFMEVQMK